MLTAELGAVKISRNVNIYKTTMMGNSRQEFSWCREPPGGARRSKRYVELPPELPTEISGKVGSDGNFRR